MPIPDKESVCFLFFILLMSFQDILRGCFIALIIELVTQTTDLLDHICLLQ